MTTWPKPVAGQVIRYAYLWKREADKGREEGLKDRPCAIVMVVEEQRGKPVVVVLPITHVRPEKTTPAIEIPLETKRRIGLDEERSWIIIDEYNWFTWPGPDLRPNVNGDLETVVIGMLPPTLFKTIRTKLAALAKAGLAARIKRTE